MPFSIEEEKKKDLCMLGALGHTCPTMYHMVDACSSHGSKLAFLEQVSQCGPENRTPKHFTRLKKAGEGGWWKPTSLQTCHLGGRGQRRGGAPVLAVPLQQHHLPAGGQAEVGRQPEEHFERMACYAPSGPSRASRCRATRATRAPGLPG